MKVKEHSNGDPKRTTTEKVMILTAGAGVALLVMIIVQASKNQPSETSTVPTVSTPAATPNLADARKEATPIPGRFPAFDPKTGQTKTAAVATPAPPTPAAPTPAPTTAVRQITHLSAQTMIDSDSSAQDRLIGKIALQIENAVKWSVEPDPEIAGKADGEAALEAFDKAAKPFTSATASRKSKTPRAMPVEPPDKLKEHVRNIVLIDASDFLLKAGSEKYQGYREAFETGFNRDEQLQAGQKPEPSVWDGHIDLVDHYIKGQMNDPDSYRFVGCWKPQLTKVDGRWSWQVKYQFRGKNAFGGVVTQTAFVTIRGGEVVGFEQD